MEPAVALNASPTVTFNNNVDEDFDTSAFFSLYDVTAGSAVTSGCL